MIREKIARTDRWKRAELVGIPVVFGLAVLLHYLYRWTGYSVWAGIFAAANESVWEHAKIYALAYLLYAAAEFFWLRPPLRAFTAAKAAGAWFLPAAIGVFFYLYTAVVGRPVLAVDLIASLLWVALAFAISYRLTRGKGRVEKWFTVAVFSLLLFFVCYLSFTVNPPHWAPFRDPQTGAFGLNPVAGVSTIPV